MTLAICFTVAVFVVDTISDHIVEVYFNIGLVID